MSDSILVALGGHAIAHAGENGDERAFRDALEPVAELIRGRSRVVITHGNGPQVGRMFVRGGGRALDICVSQTQGEIGYLIVRALQPMLERPSAALVTRCVISREDPRMRAPTKPIGAFFTQDAALAMIEQGHCMVEEVGRGWRRVVPSPRPMRIVEIDAIRALYEAGTVVIAAGGGGIPVEGDGSGVEAVIDKDFASVTLARALSIPTLLNLTSIDSVKLDFATPRERRIAQMTVAEARAHLANRQFPDGSMGPKVEAAIDYLEGGGRECVITEPARTREALAGRAGTRIVP